MQGLQAYKFELMPNGDQQRDMRRFSGACRFVFDKAWHCKKPIMKQVRNSLVMWAWPSD
jgi:putative transposase